MGMGWLIFQHFYTKQSALALAFIIQAPGVGYGDGIARKIYTGRGAAVVVIMDGERRGNERRSCKVTLGWQSGGCQQAKI